MNNGSFLVDYVVLLILGSTAFLLLLKTKATQNFILEKRKKFQLIRRLLPHYGDVYSAHTEALYRVIGFVALAGFILSLYRTIMH